jgi:adenosylhomocysteine nucleosidase
VLSLICFVTGLTAEARIASRLGLTLAGGGTPEGAGRVARALAARGATGLVSFGLAGGLNPGLAAGALVIPDAVVWRGRRYAADAALTRRLGGPVGTLYAAPAIVVSAAEKRALFETTGADAIDMESGAVAEVAAALGLGFAALRVVCDPAGTTLPPAALMALNGAGAVSMLRVAGSVLRRPGQMADLLRLGRDAARARAVLVRHVAGLRFRDD